MKKILFLILFLTSCRSITMEDYKTEISPFKYQDYEFTLNVPDDIYVIADTNIGEKLQIDKRQQHLKDVAYEVNKEIISKIGNANDTIGSIIISQEVINKKQGTFMNFFGTLPSILSLGTLNLVGYPFGTEEYKVKIFANIYDLNGQHIREYEATSKDWKFIACYYGYAPTQIQAATYLAAYKDGLATIIETINNDNELHTTLFLQAQTIKKQKKQNELKKKAEEAKKKAIEQEAKRKKEAKKQEYLKNVLDELNDI